MILGILAASASLAFCQGLINPVPTWTTLVPRSPTFLDLSNDGARVLIANSGSGSFLTEWNVATKSNPKCTFTGWQTTFESAIFLPGMNDYVTRSVDKIFRIERGTGSVHWSQFLTTSALFMTSDGSKIVASGYSDLWILDSLTGAILSQFPLANNLSRKLSVSPNGRYAAVQASRGLDIYDLETKNLLRTGPSGSCVAISPDNQLVASADTRLIIQDLLTGIPRFTFSIPTNLSVPISVNFGMDQIVRVVCARGLVAWNLSTGQTVYSVPVSGSGLYFADYSEDNSLIVGSGPDGYFKFDGNTGVRLGDLIPLFGYVTGKQDLPTSHEVAIFTQSAGAFFRSEDGLFLRSLQLPPNSLCLSTPDSKYVVTISGSTLTVTDAILNREVWHRSDLFQGSNASMSPDGSLVSVTVTNPNRIVVLKTIDGSLSATLSSNGRYSAFSNDNRFIYGRSTGFTE
ncbi:MAG: hypothetical protein JNM34_06560, partial [Chthonomonadaceae bacterium]|nr:hypothetical protein [Chthonomonadaceae bacterium]